MHIMQNSPNFKEIFLKNNHTYLQENLHYVLDICDTTGLYILDDEEEEDVDETIDEKGII